MKMTVKEALSAGYTKCGYSGHDWQTLMDISEVGEYDFERGEIVLAEKESRVFSMDGLQFLEFAVDQYADFDEIREDDYDGLTKELKEIETEFQELAQKANKVFAKRPYWMLTTIVLEEND